ncbi:MAG: DUF3365 domain-containing protein [Pirellulaceae bacterium]
MKMSRLVVWPLTAAVLVALLAMPAATAEKAKKKPAKENAAVARTRKQVKMLDDLYKTAVVLITTHYVTETSDLAAGEAAVALFAAMKEKGWHDVRLLDATGDPIEAKNSPQDDFEKQAIAKIKAGESWVEEVVEIDGQRHLRAATPIPVVLDKCILCHPHYEDFKKKGQAIGSLSYTLKVE